MLAILLGKPVQQAGRGLARHTVSGFLCLSARESGPWGVSCCRVRRGVGVNLPIVQNVGKIAARFGDLFIQLNTRKKA